MQKSQANIHISIVRVNWDQFQGSSQDTVELVCISSEVSFSILLVAPIPLSFDITKDVKNIRTSFTTKCKKVQNIQTLNIYFKKILLFDLIVTCVGLYQRSISMQIITHSS